MWSAKRRVLVLVLWLLLTMLTYASSFLVPSHELEDADYLNGESAVAERAVDNAEFDEGAWETVLIQAREGNLDRATGTAVSEELKKRYTDLGNILQIEGPYFSDDNRTVRLSVEMDRGQGTERKNPVEIVQPMLDTTESVQAAHSDLRIEQVGAGSIRKEFAYQDAKDMQRAELISIPITLAILLVAFGALAAAGLPLLLGLTAVGAALGINGLLSALVPINTFQSSLVLLLGLAVGVDYSLFYVRRQREERAAGLNTHDALLRTAATSGRTVIVSGVAVAVAAGGMFFTNSTLFAGLALGTMIVVLLAVLGSLTFIPAMLSLLGDKINSPRIPLLWRRAQASGESRIWNAILRPVLKAPVLTVILGFLIIGAMTAPMFGMKLQMPTDDQLPQSYGVVQTRARLIEAFPSEGSSHTVVVEHEPATEEQVRAALADLSAKATASGRFSAVQEPRISTSVDGRITRMFVPFPQTADSPEAEQTLQVLRTDLAPAALGGLQNATWAVGGGTAFSSDVSHLLQERLPIVVGFVLLLSLIVMLLAFRSIIIAMLTTVLNVLSVAASFGVITLVFQNEWAEGLLGFQSSGFIVAWIPIILFVVLIGLSMDYNVFILSRIREPLQRGGDLRDSIRHGIASSAGVVTSAAMVMVAVFSVFATLSTLEMKQLGVGLAIAILVDITLVRALLLPGILVLLGRSPWKEHRMLRRLPSIAHD
ncbi:MMPL family transporter [Actinoplanes sichuanensis]|uniref:MMPL family transporter n=1 Tax=Actinoplanes sichuanensis TaxID=512349 RepID=A0ABW4AM20_9ACTN|nr:MMPL family transporter [Actinoplanes sichuanensis]BEL08261.1 MMPL family transporter [Actinoplanes sichuanensis]